jgi:hypothetical protein
MSFIPAPVSVMKRLDRVVFVREEMLGSTEAAVVHQHDVSELPRRKTELITLRWALRLQDREDFWKAVAGSGGTRTGSRASRQ